MPSGVDERARLPASSRSDLLYGEANRQESRDRSEQPAYAYAHQNQPSAADAVAPRQQIDDNRSRKSPSERRERQQSSRPSRNQKRNRQDSRPLIDADYVGGDQRVVYQRLEYLARAG